jgi:hypothetical protein
MTHPLIPPRGIFVSSQLLFHPTMTAVLKDTLIQMIALTWGSKARMTPALTYPLLEQLTRKSARRLYGQLTVLRKKYSALELQSAGNGTFVITLAGWLFESSGDANNSFKQTPVKEEEEELTCIDSKEIPVLLNDSDQEEECEGKPQKIAKFCNRKPLRKPIRALSAGLREKLLAAGVFPVLLDEIAVSPYSEEDLTALLAWSTTDQPDNPAPLLIGRLRANANPPKIYRQPPCPYCGRYGSEHADDCRGRYLSGSYAEFLKQE